MPAATTPSPPALVPPRRSWLVPFMAAALVAGLWISCFNFPLIWKLTGIGEADKPFLDLCNLLSAGEAVQHGLNPYLNNPFDPYHRPHGYTTWWLVTGPWGVTLADAAWLGSLLLVAMLIAAVWLLRPTDWKQGGTFLLFLVSPPLLLAVSRMNHDLIVFTLMCAALACFRRDRPAWRAFGVVLLAVSAVLKYFPLAAVLILIDARSRREFAGWVLLYVLVLVLAWPSLEQGLRTAARHTPTPAWLFAFGAPVFFRNLGLPAATTWGWLAAGPMLLAGAATWWTSTARKEPPATGETRRWEREFACGAVMIVGCFLHGSSYLYKMVFALWLLPWLWRATLDHGEERWRKATLFLLLAVLWFEGGAALAINLSVYTEVLPQPVARRLLKVTIQIGQLFTWALVTCLGRALLLYLGRETNRLLAGPR